MIKTRSGFTIVELLIVVVVIALLAAISLVAYTGIQKRAAEVTLQSDLRQAKTYMERQKIDTGSFPTDTSDIPKSPSSEYELSFEGTDFCLTATTSTANASPFHITTQTGVASGPCLGHEYGGPAPAGVNIAPPFSQWTLSGGAMYNTSTKEITFTTTNSTAVSPYIRVDSPLSFTMSADINSPVKDAGPDGQRVYGSSYFDGSYTPYTLSNGYTGNGSAGYLPANTWTRPNWTITASGPNFMYLQFRLQVSTSYGVPGTRMRDPIITLTR